MRAFVVTGPRSGLVDEVEPPRAVSGEVVVGVERIGVCGTDVEFFTGEMAYLHQGHAEYPIRLGHEWCGTVVSVGDGVDGAWLGRRVTGDTMIGCGRCARCLGHRHHVCSERYEIGIRGGWPGALAEQLVVPCDALFPLPESMEPAVGALVEPGGNAYRAVQAAHLAAGARVLIFGPGTIGLLAAQFALAAGAEVHVVGLDRPSVDFASSLGLHGAWLAHELPALAFDAVIDATNSPEIPARCIEIVEPGGVVVYIGLAGTPSYVDSRSVALKDLRVVGVLGGSAGLAGAITSFADATVDPRPLVAATVGFEDIGRVLSGWRPTNAGRGPKIHIDPAII